MSPEADHPEPMSAKDLESLRWQISNNAGSPYAEDRWFSAEAGRLLAEVDRLAPCERERKAWHDAVVAFVDACCPTYSTDAADGPADLIPALEDAAATLLRLTAENELPGEGVPA